MTTPNPSLRMNDCESCGDNIDDPDVACFHNGHQLCESCLTNCSECGDAARADDYLRD